MDLDCMIFNTVHAFCNEFLFSPRFLSRFLRPKWVLVQEFFELPVYFVFFKKTFKKTYQISPLKTYPMTRKKLNNRTHNDLLDVPYRCPFLVCNKLSGNKLQKEAFC